MNRKPGANQGDYFLLAILGVVIVYAV